MHTSGLDLATKSAGSLSPLKHQMLSSHRLIRNGNDWCISVLDILSDFLATSDLAIFDIQLYVFWESPKRDLKERALKN